MNPATPTLTMLANKHTSGNNKNNRAGKIYPTNEEEYGIYGAQVQLHKHFIGISQDELEEMGVSSFRIKLAVCLKDMGV